MKIELHEIPVRDLVESYKDCQEEGVVGYGGRLNIRPPYQREFVYKEQQRKPEFKYNSWYGCVMIRKGSFDETFLKALSVAYIVAFFAILSPVFFFAFVILFGLINVVLPTEVAMPISLFLFVAVIGRVVYLAWRGMATFYDWQDDSCSESSESGCAMIDVSSLTLTPPNTDEYNAARTPIFQRMFWNKQYNDCLFQKESS